MERPRPKTLNVVIVIAAAASCPGAQVASAFCTSVQNAATFSHQYKPVNILWTLLEHILQLLFTFLATSFQNYPVSNPPVETFLRILIVATEMQGSSSHGHINTFVCRTMICC